MKNIQKHIELSILYFGYILFIFSIKFNAISNVASYTGNILFISACLIFVLIREDVYKIVASIYVWLIFLFCVLFFGFGSFFGLSPYGIIFYLKVIVLIVFFYNSKIKLLDFIGFLNNTYLIYLFLSLLVYFNIIPQLVEKDNLNIFIESYFGLTFTTMYGIEGSTASIDSYSALVLVINLFLNTNKKRFIFVFLSLFIALWTTRMTPIVSVIVIIIAYIFTFNRKLALMLIIFPMIIFIIVIYLLVYQSIYVSYEGASIPFVDALAFSTHSRAYFWQSQLTYLLNDYSIKDYIFGRFDEGFDFDLIIGNRVKNNNPHNSYLYLFYRSPLLFLIFYNLFLTYFYKNYRKAFVPPIFFILLSSFTNVSILGIYNPSYLLVIVFLLVEGAKNKNDEFSANSSSPSVNINEPIISINRQSE